MAINRIYDELSDYKVGVEDVSDIELTEHGGGDTTIYKVTYKDESVLYVGLLEHRVDQWDLGDQASIFDYL